MVRTFTYFLAFTWLDKEQAWCCEVVDWVRRIGTAIDSNYMVGGLDPRRKATSGPVADRRLEMRNFTRRLERLENRRKQLPKSQFVPSSEGSPRPSWPLGSDVYIPKIDRERFGIDDPRSMEVEQRLLAWYSTEDFSTRLKWMVPLRGNQKR